MAHLVLSAALIELGSWSVKEIAGLVVTGVLVLVLWLIFRRLKYPE